ncbi:hypothetical protein N9903_01455 [bacterium]|nr:hypothetical protein [bacterium]
MNLVVQGENDFLTDVEDAESLAFRTEGVLMQVEDVRACVTRGRKNAEGNSYDSQINLWRNFMGGFVVQ